ncbi:unnamed protein product [Eruca vesicaria subsp. sativa]|uniref:RING-type E3 ubiquitin transferase n=1 Tax=Eruca vesicaria subsp. sativa TaxID=29727 RepID=A0ABC8LTI2_ERUVS|nr:unnamed protein product [Eruca vesicaria subsp. sativa]
MGTRGISTRWKVFGTAEHCADAEVIYKFLEVNEIGKTYALYYIAYTLHMEFKSKVKTANEIFNLGISRNAKPIEKLNDVYKKFIVRTMRSPKTADEEPKENDMPSRSFGTVLSRGDINNAGRQALGSQVKKTLRSSDRYWCHMCSQIVNPILDAEIKCPLCQNGFVEEMSGENNVGSSNSNSKSLREIQDSEIDFSTDCALTLWGPILLGMTSNHHRRRRFRTELGLDNDEVNVPAPNDVDGNDNNVDNHHHHHYNRRRHRHMQHDGEADLGREFDSIIRRRWRSAAAILQLFQGIREGLNTEDESSENRSQFNRAAYNLIRTILFLLELEITLLEPG